MPNFVQNTFVGYNNRVSPFQIPDDTLVKAVNVVLNDLGNIKKRNGYSKYNATAR